LDVSIKEWEIVSFRWDLRKQLERFQPEIVVGEGYRIFVLAKDLRVSKNPVVWPTKTVELT